MDHSISGITRAAPAPSAVAPAGEAGFGWVGLLGQVAHVAPGHCLATEAPAPAPATVRSGDFGRGGRFEKFILALQALSLDAGAATNRTDRVERMRAAAEELFGIDGMPQPVRPLTGPPSSFPPAVDPEQVERPRDAEPDRAPVARLSEPTRPRDASTATTSDPAPLDPAQPISPAATPSATEAASPAPGGTAATS